MAKGIMRDTSAWTLNPQVSKPQIEMEISNLYPGFVWRSGTTNYVISDFGEDWGDQPATRTELRDRDLPSRYQYGGFAVGGDTVTLDNGNILRVISEPAMSLGTDVFYKYITAIADVYAKDTLSLTTAPKATTGIGVADSGVNVVTLFYISSANSKLRSITYTVGTGWASEGDYTASPVFSESGVAVAPISGTEGFVLSYSPTTFQTTLHYFTGSTWTSKVVSLRTKQHYLNCHWFDAEILDSTKRLVTFNVNGVQYATIVTTAGITYDPWRVFAFDPEFGGVQVRICKLTKVGTRVVGTAWARFASSNNEYEVSYYQLVWTDDGYDWAMPEEGFIGRVASRGKVHKLGNYALVIGSSVSYVGSAVQWLGGAAGLVTTLANNVTNQVITQDIDQAADAKLPLLIPDSFDKSLLQYGNKIIVREGLVGEVTKVDLGQFTLDTPGTRLIGSGQDMQIVARGPLKKLIGYSVPMDMTIEGPRSEYADFEEGGIYSRSGTWLHEEGTGYCATHEGDIAIATVGLEYLGQFQLNTRIRITQDIATSFGSVVFWYEGLQDYWRVDLIGSTNKIALQKVEAGITTTISDVAVTGGVVAGTWYNIIIRYISGTLSVFVKPSGGSWQSAITLSSWTTQEPLHWYAGLACSLPNTTTTASLAFETRDKVSVADSTKFPSPGYVTISNETIYYASKSSGVQLNSLIRGIRSTRVSHPNGSIVRIANQRFEADYFSMFKDDRPFSVADACSYVSTISGVKLTARAISLDGGSGIRVFPELHAHGWVLEGTYSTTADIYFWTNVNVDGDGIPTSGFRLRLTTTSATLSDVVSGDIESQTISIPSSGVFKTKVDDNGIFLWINGIFICGINLPNRKDFRIGCVAVGDGVVLSATEMFEPIETIVWAMQEPARQVLSRILDGRDAYLRERYDGSIEVTHLDRRDDLGTLTGQYFVTYTQQNADQEWASAMVAWGGEDWVLVMHPDADRLRWMQWQTPHIYDRSMLRDRGMRRLRKMWALKDLRTFEGPYDPRMEVGDQLSISSIRGIPDGTYMVRSLEIIGSNNMLDMRVTVQALPDDLVNATWPILPGVDRPSYGE